MPSGAGKKREKEYEELKERFQESGRYEGRKKEVAARIVNSWKSWTENSRTTGGGILIKYCFYCTCSVFKVV